MFLHVSTYRLPGGVVSAPGALPVGPAPCGPAAGARAVPGLLSGRPRSRPRLPDRPAVRRCRSVHTMEERHILNVVVTAAESTKISPSKLPRGPGRVMGVLVGCDGIPYIVHSV